MFQFGFHIHRCKFNGRSATNKLGRWGHMDHVSWSIRTNDVDHELAPSRVDEGNFLLLHSRPIKASARLHHRTPWVRADQVKIDDDCLDFPLGQALCLADGFVSNWLLKVTDYYGGTWWYCDIIFGEDSWPQSDKAEPCNSICYTPVAADDDTWVDLYQFWLTFSGGDFSLGGMKLGYMLMVSFGLYRDNVPLWDHQNIT